MAELHNNDKTDSSISKYKIFIRLDEVIHFFGSNGQKRVVCELENVG